MPSPAERRFPSIAIAAPGNAREALRGLLALLPIVLGLGAAAPGEALAQSIGSAEPPSMAGEVPDADVRNKSAEPQDGVPVDPSLPADNTAKTTKKSSGSDASSQSIVVLVNDEPITAYEVLQRQRFIGLSANIRDDVQKEFQGMIKSPGTTEKLKAILNETIKANQGKSKDEVIAIFEKRKKDFALSMQKQAMDRARARVLPGLRKQAVEELIDERIKLQEAKRLNAVVEDADVEKILAGIAERNKMTVEQFADHLKGMGADISTMRARFRAELSWRDVIRRRFGQQISVTQGDVDRFVKTAEGGVEDRIELDLQRISLPVSGKNNQSAVAQRVAEAASAAAQFNGCDSTAVVAAGIKGAKFDVLSGQKPASIPEPTRSLLLNARDGEMLPPTVAQGSVELWVVCGRKVVKADDQKREVAENSLRQKEFDILARKHLKDLRQDAAIEYRDGRGS